MQRLIFESSPILILVCAAVALAGAWFLYRGRHSWGQWTTRLLFLFRATLLFFIALLLLGPIIKLIQNTNEKPAVVFLVDNSSSVRAVLDSVKTDALLQQVDVTRQMLTDAGFETELKALSNNAQVFSHPQSDLNSALRNIETDYDEQNLASIVLVSDGIYNTGASPAYASFKTPIFTMAIGDSVQRKDVVLHALRYNKVAYQGNRFPMQAEVRLYAMPNAAVTVSVLHNGKAVATAKQTAGNKTFLLFDFVLDAEQSGIQRYDVLAQTTATETNTRNNLASAFIEVVEGRKKIALIAPAPHPDIKAIRAVIEKNQNYELILQVPGVKEASAENLLPEKIDLAIFLQAPDVRGLTSGLFQRYLDARVPLFLMLGQQSNLRALPTAGIALNFESAGQWDEAFGVAATQVASFTLPDNLNNSLVRYPPLVIPFGKFAFPLDAKVILYQRIGSVNTQRPLLWYIQNDDQKIGVLGGEGIWRWRLKEFDLHENTEVFDALFGKFIQFMSSKDDRRKFRSFPTKQQFNETEYVVFESQLFNDLYEPQFGNEVTLTVVNNGGQSSRFTYTPTAARPQYQFSLPAGVYRYSASITRNGKEENDRGQFSIAPIDIESQNLTADFQLLRTLANNTGGQFFKSDDFKPLQSKLISQKPPAIVHSDESFSPLIDIKLLFVALLILISTEWFFRKFWGSY